jgi:hypothetical protein
VNIYISSLEYATTMSSEKLDLKKFGIKKLSDVVVEISGAKIERTLEEKPVKK